MAAMTIADVLALSRFVPVVTIERAGDAVPLARALLAGGVRAIEVTLRSEAALAAIRAIAAEAPELAAGAGTCLEPAHLAEAAAAGARFAVSPGFTAELCAAAKRQAGLPWLPGIATASEAMQAMAAGYQHLKFFPAEAMGGLRTLKDLHGPLPRLRFCPTGGVGLENAASYLALPNVAAVGGSALTPKDALAKGDWARVTALARRAAAL
jgi:2-dehydro-3-deoxyphosphogluconate aldolase / (4S)-4-hydroxy-2-oxoglutarate aldolase